MIIRKQFPLLLSDDEKELIVAYAKMKGWTVSKAIRILSRALIDMDINKATLETAMAKATIADGEGKK